MGRLLPPHSVARPPSPVSRKSLAPLGAGVGRRAGQPPVLLVVVGDVRP